LAGLKDNFPAVVQGGSQTGWKVTPDEIDQDQSYLILHPSVATDWFGTSINAAAVALVENTSAYADYPRNLLLTITGVAGGIGGTLNGLKYTDQFGGTVSETLGAATAASSVTVTGTGVCAKIVNLGTFTPAGLGGTAIATVALGFAIATTSASPVFGLPAKLGGTNDIKRVTWDDAGTPKAVVTTPAGAAVVTKSAVRIEVSGGIAVADAFNVVYRSSYNSHGVAQISNS
jgi:hypothetical protein